MVDSTLGLQVQSWLRRQSKTLLGDDRETAPQLSEYIIFLSMPLNDHSSITNGNLNAYKFYRKPDIDP